MKYLKKFNESSENNEVIEMLEDYLLEYFEKWKIIEDTKYLSLEFDDRKDYNGTYAIRPASTTFFGITGFPDGKKGYRIKITILRPIDENEFKKDIASFINRVCKSGYKYDTYHDDYSSISKGYYIAFFK